ncbi:hypothetical protein EB354_06455 [Chryseobacterium balustinum]|uniref:Uncharacterized protein n=2 Tax=Chryseobacterium balustinum TaxID=246 RepID=A0AAX2IN72_9FLAO|nr:hypothetical protein EB354_06455 [Chryseobacterium balustinum]SKB62254.1 hypothetical protein SAMN05421800_104178 [Chryseobacterium balustinum]SQA91260.1 Uncharacterised protein [Chryseobacterium balustinum]
MNMNKYVLKIILPAILVFTFKLNAQQKVYSKQEIGKFKENEQFYLNKKVKNILRDLKVNFEIAYVGGGWSEEMSFIVLRFNNRKDEYQLQQKGIKLARLTLFY